MRGLLLVTVLAVGCANTIDLKKPHPVKFANAEYPNKETALEAISAMLKAELASVEPRPYQGGSVLIHLPTDAQLTSSQPFMTAPVSREEYMYSFWIEYWKGDLNFQRDVLRKSGIFDSVELKRVDGYESYAWDYGYRYMIVATQNGLQMQDIVTGEVKDVSGPPGGKNYVGRVEGAARRFSRDRSAPVARDAQPASHESLSYDAQSRRGSLSVGDSGIEGRARLIGSIGRLCSGKNVAIKAGHQPTEGGVFEITDESLADDVFTIDFRCLY